MRVKLTLVGLGKVALQVSFTSMQELRRSASRLIHQLSTSTILKFLFVIY